MKRIDEKIKEIEQKDKSSRILYIVFIGAILVAMAIILSQIKGIKERDNTITKKNVELSEQDIKLTDTYKALDSAYLDLKNSLKPEDYWNYIKHENTHESYISYLTNNWTIKKPEHLIDKAIKNINSLKGKKHLKGWIHGGLTSGGVYKPHKKNGKYIFKIILRKDNGKFNANSKLKKGDVIQLLYSQNWTTYETTRTTGLLKRGNEEGWRPGTKAYVSKVEDVGAETKIEIRYY